MTDTAPIALFAFNRPGHTRETVESLARNAGAGESDLFIFSDAARDGQSEPGVAAVRAYIRTIRGFRSVTVVEREFNLGLAGSIIEGVSRLCSERGRVIVLEDDIVTSPWFLDFMNRALDRYAAEPRVMHVSGYMFPVSRPERLPEAFFYRATSCWGWGTWARAWRQFEPDAGKLLAAIRSRGLTREFDVMGTIGYERMLAQQARDCLDSWAIRWYASVFLAGGLCLHPARSLSRNIGHDGTGIHCGTTSIYDVEPAQVPVRDLPELIEESPEAAGAMAGFYRAIRPPAYKRIIPWLRFRLGLRRVRA